MPYKSDAQRKAVHANKHKTRRANKNKDIGLKNFNATNDAMTDKEHQEFKTNYINTQMPKFMRDRVINP